MKITDEYLSILMRDNPELWRALRMDVLATFTETDLEDPEIVKIYNLTGAVLKMYYTGYNARNNYLITEAASKVIKRIRIKDPVNPSPLVFEGLRDRVHHGMTFIEDITIDKNTMIRFTVSRHNENVIVNFIWLFRDTKLTMDFSTSQYMLTNEGAVYHGSEDNLPYAKLLLQHLIFLHLSETKVEILEPKQKYGKTRKQGKIVNGSGHSVTVVDSKWNVISVRADGFTVGGHFRLQRVGKGRKSIRLIYIDEFEKHGYTKRAKNERAN